MRIFGIEVGKEHPPPKTLPPPSQEPTKVNFDTKGKYLIESDGTAWGTVVYDEKGNEINKRMLISKIEWNVEGGRIANAVITVASPKIKVEVEKENVTIVENGDNDK